MSTYYLDGYSLTVDMIRDIAQDSSAEVLLGEDARASCSATRKQIERWMEKDAPAVYGINTGLGNLKDVVVPPEQHVEWNKTLPYPHAAGMGEYLPPLVTLTSLLIRANVLARAYSGVRPELIDRVLSVYNAKVAPAVHSEGSTGLSDLGPLAQNVMTIAGLPEAKAYLEGELMPSVLALEKAGLEPAFVLECKEVLAQMNGSTMTQAIAVLAFIKFEDMLPELFSLINATDSASKHRINAYKRVIAFAKSILDKENNISCDNPLLFEIGQKEYEAVMGCNCSNTQVGYVLDILNTIISEMAGDIASTVQEGAKKEKALLLMSKIKTCAMQVSADSIPTKGGQEDHVEFSYTAARKFCYAVDLIGKLSVIK